jgi:hypothetical protein
VRERSRTRGFWPTLTRAVRGAVRRQRVGSYRFPRAIVLARSERSRVQAAARRWCVPRLGSTAVVLAALALCGCAPGEGDGGSSSLVSARTSGSSDGSDYGWLGGPAFRAAADSCRRGNTLITSAHIDISGDDGRKRVRTPRERITGRRRPGAFRRRRPPAARKTPASDRLTPFVQPVTID